MSLWLLWIHPILVIRYRLETRLCVLIPIHQTADFSHDGIEGLRLISVDMMPRPPHIVDLHIRLWSQFPDPLSCTAVHPRPGSVDQSQRDRLRERGRSYSVYHWTLCPADWDLHVIECSFTPGGRERGSEGEMDGVCECVSD